MKRVLWIMAWVALATGCSHPPPAQRQPIAVRVERVGVAQTFDTGARYSGSVKPFRQVDVAFKNAGYVESLLTVPHVVGPSREVQVGDGVRRGTVLATLQEADYVARVRQAEAGVGQAAASVAQARAGRREIAAERGQAAAQVKDAEAGLAQAQAALNEARAGRQQAEHSYDRARKLLAVDSITAPDFDAASESEQAARARQEQAEAQIRSLQAKVDAARAQMAAFAARTQQAGGQVAGAEASERAARAQLSAARLALADCQLKCPFDGVVTARAIERGALVGSGTVAFTMVDTRWVKVAFSVPDLDVDRLRPGQPLTVRLEAVPGETFTGRISSISPAADPRSRVYEVEVAVPNAKGRLKAGMIGSLDVPGARRRQPTMAVPLAAVVRAKDHPNGYAVFVVERRGEQAIAHLHDVTIGPVVGNQMTIRSGLAPNAEVIVSGTEFTGDGDTVHVVP